MQRNVFIKSLVLFVCCIYIFSSVSCSYYIRRQNRKPSYIKNIDYEKRSLDIYADGHLGIESCFFTPRSIINDDKYVYAISNGTEKSPGKIFKIKKDDFSYECFALQDLAQAYGYTDSQAYNLSSIVMNADNLIILTKRTHLMFDNIWIEIFCLDKNDLSIKWRWMPEDNGWHGLSLVDEAYVTPWEDKYVFVYEHGYFYFLVLDKSGNVITNRFMERYMPMDYGFLQIRDDKLFLHHGSSPFTVYNIKSLMNSEIPFEDCIEFKFDEVSTTVYNNIVLDEKNAYFAYWKPSPDLKDRAYIGAMSLDTYELQWEQLLDWDYDGVGMITLKDKKLYVPADYGCVYCFNTEDGNLDWKTLLTNSGQGNMNALQQGCIVGKYYVQPSSDNKVSVLDLKRGTIECEIPMYTGTAGATCFGEKNTLYITDRYTINRIKFK